MLVDNLSEVWFNMLVNKFLFWTFNLVIRISVNQVVDVVELLLDLNLILLVSLRLHLELGVVV